ncbi:hypothetical protein C0J52_23493 [Blattella germanica]|nr:hypothetical protein C0J52_23493 [Blattella germanica]
MDSRLETLHLSDSFRTPLKKVVTISNNNDIQDLTLHIVEYEEMGGVEGKKRAFCVLNYVYQSSKDWKHYTCQKTFELP